jgi:dynein heavy chain
MQPEVITAVGSSQEVQLLVSRISALTKPYVEVAFDPFSAKNAVQWKAIMNNFWSDVESIETGIHQFIDKSFKNLRSAENALKMVIKFKNIKSREAINAQMNGKFGDILAQYEKQVLFLQRVFSCVMFLLCVSFEPSINILNRMTAIIQIWS